MATTTRQALRRQFATYLGYGHKVGLTPSDAWSTTTNIATSAVAISSELRNAGFDDLGAAGSGDDLLEAHWVWFVDGNNASVERMVKSYDASAGQVTVTGANLASEGAATDFEVHEHRPSLLHDVLNRARLKAFPMLFLPIHRTIMTARDQQAYEVPTAIIGKPLTIHLEDGFPATTWANNLLTNGGLETWSGGSATGWTAATGLTITQEQTTSDPYNYMVRRGQSSARVTNGTTGTARAFYEAITSPDTHSGQRLAFLIWVYCMEANVVSTYIRLNSTEHTGTAQDGGLHGGTGWELLTHYEDALSALTTLRFGIQVAAGTSTGLEIYVDEAIALAGPQQEPQEAAEQLDGWEYRPLHEGTQLRNMVHFPYSLPDNYLMRFYGRGYLTEVTAETGTIEIGLPQNELLFAYAAEELYERLARSGGNRDRAVLLGLAAQERGKQGEFIQHRMPMARPALLIPDWSR